MFHFYYSLASTSKSAPLMPTSLPLLIPSSQGYSILYVTLVSSKLSPLPSISTT